VVCSHSYNNGKSTLICIAASKIQLDSNPGRAASKSLLPPGNQGSCAERANALLRPANHGVAGSRRSRFVGKEAVLTTNAWSSIAPVSYRLTDDEILSGLLPQKQQSQWLRPAFLAVAFVQVLVGGLHVYAHRTLGDLWFGALYIVVGLVFAFQSQSLDFMRRRSLRAPREFRLHFDDVGITFDGSPQKTFPWRSIRSVQDVGDVFIFRCGTWRSITVPKRVFPDDGAALWALLEDRLIAKRDLNRRPGARTIVNTTLTA
jgi:hypothetical protein